MLSLVYTSGTTGKPKGVMLKQINPISACYAMQTRRVLPEEEPRNSLGKPMTSRQEFILAILPLAHIYMRVLVYFHYINGGAVGFPSLPGTASMLTDLGTLRITIFGLVPRVI